MALRPSSFVILLAYGALLILIFVTPCWYVIILRMEKHVKLSNSKNSVSQLQSEIEQLGEVLRPMKSSSTNMARFLSSSLHDITNVSFSDIKSKVAPFLFAAFETIPYLAEISYIGVEGLFFSYYTHNHQVLAMYCNSSSTSVASNKIFIQPVNPETGELHGEPKNMLSNPFINASWIGEALNVSTGFSSFRTKWVNSDLLFLTSARIITRGLISLGFSATPITHSVTRIDQQHGTSSYLATKDGQVVVPGIQLTHFLISNDTVSFQSLNANTTNGVTVSCRDETAASSFNIRDIAYSIHCYTIDIMGIESVYVLAVPKEGYAIIDGNYKEKGLIVFVATMVTIFIAFFSFLYVNCRAFRREMHLCASLIKQCEATQQAEKKNMNKSTAFASASHDVRASLAGITGLIEISSELVDPGSELETNLKQMNGCTQDLLGLLNSILDTSKIEAGKMQLEEEEFDVFNLLEDVVDFYHPVAAKKGVDLVLDPCDGSVVGYSRVKGDRGKLKQVLGNLLSNAVKFTDEGHIAVRAWTRKPKLLQNSSTVTFNQFGFKQYLSCLFRNKTQPRSDVESTRSIQEDPHSMDFIFEVDDTGKGIPKENYKSVFENYVQIKDTSLGQGGTGLGLGIVQSLVRLMHGDIEIVEKDTGERGTCFKFNVVLSVCENEAVSDGVGGGSGDRIIECEEEQQTMQASCSGSSRICAMSPKLRICSSSPKPEASLVVLLIVDQERQRTSQRFMERLGIKVKVVNTGKGLFNTLRKIKLKAKHSSGQNSPASSDLSYWSTPHSSLDIATRVSLSSMEGTEHMPLVFKKTDVGASPGFILVVIDANAGPFSELYTIVSNFKKELRNPCKVVWLDKPFMRRINLKALNQDDIVTSKPFHGTRLFQTIKLLPEFGGSWQSNCSRAKREMGNEKVDDGETQQEIGKSSGSEKALRGKKFLVADDSAILRNIASATLISLGATVEQCENGEQAVRLVDEGLAREYPHPPYDYILMDCQMPIMGGLDATKWIRKIEKAYGVRIPIIALTAATERITIESGMDYHMDKPINREDLLKAITYINGKV
ncbi:histidine kinase CKI1 [Vigna radiata var. radiata]|uniref:histidine kinase n=1 Tax=Vigna radiata var. radiata TaxID=3916 RepID=A0A1S3V089_VIGRR|nr:histidine kinase CKI1 [Vigna radiata var. radiata]